MKNKRGSSPYVIIFLGFRLELSHLVIPITLSLLESSIKQRNNKAVYGLTLVSLLNAAVNSLIS